MGDHEEHGRDPQQKPFVANDELASAMELNTFFTRFEDFKSKERCGDVLSSVQLHPDDRVEISAAQVANVFGT